MCRIGRRLYERQMVAANEGNISCRLDDGRVLCTRTLICKGFMDEEDLCVVDMDGRHVGGFFKPTSEILLHLEAYRGDPNVNAVVHCHPPHALAFAVTGEDIPSGVVPEVEIFLGHVPLAPYATPSTTAFAETIRPFVGKARAVLLSNHGIVTWGADLERAYWYAEILESYCRMLLLARQIGDIRRLSESQVRELHALRTQFGIGQTGPS